MFYTCTFASSARRAGCLFFILLDLFCRMSFRGLTSRLLRKSPQKLYLASRLTHTQEFSQASRCTCLVRGAVALLLKRFPATGGYQC